MGDLHHQSLSLKKGAYFAGRSVQAVKEKQTVPEKAWKKLRSVPSDANREAAVAAAPAR